MVGVKDCDEVAVCLLQRGVDVAGLGALVVWPGEVFDAQFLAERPHFIAATVVEHFQSERFHLLKMWIMLRAIGSAVWPGKLAFNVTQKDGEGADRRLRDLALIRWQLVAGSLCIAAAAWAVSTLVFTEWNRNLTGASLAITLV